jgi:hypothetical protein
MFDACMVVLQPPLLAELEAAYGMPIARYAVGTILIA